jgi:dTDP-4-dehydrorhamnose 3,5-epimerase
VIFEPAPIEGAFVIETEPVEDERGFFARTFCQERSTT